MGGAGERDRAQHVCRLRDNKLSAARDAIYAARVLQTARRACVQSSTRARCPRGPSGSHHDTRCGCSAPRVPAHPHGAPPMHAAGASPPGRAPRQPLAERFMPGEMHSPAGCRRAPGRNGDRAPV